MVSVGVDGGEQKNDRFFSRSDGSKLEILFPPSCDICGNPIPNSFERFPYCGACKDYPDKNDPLIRVRAFGKYYYQDHKPDDILSNEIRSLKTDISFIPQLLECLYYSLEEQYDELFPPFAAFDSVVPAPRGSDDGNRNPSELLAKGIASRFNIEFQDVLFKKSPYRPMHTIHDHHEKEREISGKIGCHKRLDGQRVLLIDDTCITMATKKECARALRGCGASDIWALVLGKMVNQPHMEILRRYNG